MGDYDSDLRAEMKRQAQWDIALKGCPECSCCGSPVLMQDSYLEYEDIVLCEECINRFTLSTLDLDDE